MLFFPLLVTEILNFIMVKIIFLDKIQFKNTKKSKICKSMLKTEFQMFCKSLRLLWVTSLLRPKQFKDVARMGSE